MDAYAEIEALLNRMIEQQRMKVLETGRRYVPGATHEDLRNAEDFVELRDKPIFHYEDGILAGFIAARYAIVQRKNGL